MSNNLIQFLTALDPLRGDTEIALLALHAFFEANPLQERQVDCFSPAFLANLIPETALILRVQVERLLASGDEAAMEARLPPLTVWAEHLQALYTEALASGEQEGETTQGRKRISGLVEESLFCLLQVLQAAQKLPNVDEVGRRAMASLLVEIISNLVMPDAIFAAAATLLASLGTPSEWLQRATLLISDLQAVYGGNGDTENKLGSEDEGVSLEVAILAQLRALQLGQMALERTDTPSDLVTLLLNEVVIGAVNSGYAVVQAAGLRCLGLCCTLSPELTSEYAPLLLQFYRLEGQPETRKPALEALLDLALIHGLEVMPAGVVRVLSGALALESGMAATAAEGLARLLLHNRLGKETEAMDLLQGLLLLYLHPAASEDAHLRQCLAYFLPVYAHGEAAHGELLAACLIPCLRALLITTGGTSGPSLSRVISQLLYWCPEAALDRLALNAAWSLLEVEDEGGKWPRLLSTLLLPKINPRQLSGSCIRQLLSIVGAYLRYSGDKPTQTALRKLLGIWIEVGETSLSLEEQQALDDRLAACLRGRTPMQPAIQNGVSGVRRKTKRAEEEEGVSNLLDDMDDILAD